MGLQTAARGLHLAHHKILSWIQMCSSFSKAVGLELNHKGEPLHMGKAQDWNVDPQDASKQSFLGGMLIQEDSGYLRIVICAGAAQRHHLGQTGGSFHTHLSVFLVTCDYSSGIHIFTQIYLDIMRCKKGRNALKIMPPLLCIPRTILWNVHSF